ncbi:hypothetical protein JW868_03610 [Candidatus Woesearchaeota archaeon]|nr:hypothetical protein [Candidatus Woesearchaeota archaeon]
MKQSLTSRMKNSSVRIVMLLLILLVVIILASLTASVATAQPTQDTVHTQLLTVSGNEGGIADLYLTVKPGSGSVFLETQPLTKLDTQISTRFANSIACKYAKIDCTKYDFFYRIKANSGIVGGPSASAPIALVTYAALTSQQLDENVVMTGTINPGGLIGSVEGIQSKILAAKDQGYNKVLIPALSTYNQTELQETAKDVEVVEVATFEEVLYYTLAVPIPPSVAEIQPHPQYSEIMEDVAKKLCNRSKELDELTRKFESSMKEDAINKTEKAFAELENSNYYSAASLCFGANVDFRRLQLSDYDQAELRSVEKKTYVAIEKLEVQLERKTLKSLPELETYAIVKERLLDAKDSLTDDNLLLPLLLANVTQNLSYLDTAYAVERYYSAIVWSDFFALKGPEYDIDDSHLKEGCNRKIQEAQSRLDYAELYFPFGLDNVQTELDYAREDHNKQDYALCIFKASKAKADASVIISGISVSQDKLEKLIEIKVNVSAKIIQDQIDKGNFPILGYSYYEYTQVLAESDPLLALTFGEYALELSNLDMYFPRKESTNFDISIDANMIITFSLGFVAGLLVAVILLKSYSHKKEKRK